MTAMEKKTFEIQLMCYAWTVEITYGGLSELGAKCLFFSRMHLHSLMTSPLKPEGFELFCDFRGWLPFCFWEEQVDKNCWSDQDSNKDEEAKRTKKHLEIKNRTRWVISLATLAPIDSWNLLICETCSCEIRNRLILQKQYLFIFSICSWGSRWFLKYWEVLYINGLHMPQQ